MTVTEDVKLKDRYNHHFKCGNCSWYRDVSTDSKILKAKIQSPIYGEVTVEELAKLDIANHDCEKHEFAKAGLFWALKKVGGSNA